MPAYQHILQTYGSLAAKSGQMLDAARNGDWERLIELEQDCRAIAATLKRVEHGTAGPDAAYLERKAELIHKVLADDAAIRQFTEPRMTHLATYLGSAQQENRLRQAYETDHGS